MIEKGVSASHATIMFDFIWISKKTGTAKYQLTQEIGRNKTELTLYYLSTNVIPKSLCHR